MPVAVAVFDFASDSIAGRSRASNPALPGGFAMVTIYLLLQSGGKNIAKLEYGLTLISSLAHP